MGYNLGVTITRRGFLVGAGATAAGLTLGSCSNGSSSPSTTVRGRPGSPPTTASPRIRRAGERPDPSRPEGTDLLPQIEHVVVVMMENHSYDNYLGVLRRGDGLDLDAAGRPTVTGHDAAGRSVRAFHMPNTCQVPKHPNQDWNATHAQWNHGQMDGFVRSASGPVSMGYWTAEDLPFYHSLASTFPLCDRWFGSCMGQTYPNRRFLLAGTAQGNIDTKILGVGDYQPPNGTIMGLLDKHRIPWRNYFTDLPTTALFAPSLGKSGASVVRIPQLFTDAAAGTLPAFSVVDPNFDHASEENSDDISTGESFVADVVDAVMSGPGWPKTLLVWLYDEHGGYYDHVPPPRAVPPDRVRPRLKPGDAPGGYDIYGFRVPAVVISPYARRDYVSHVVHDHTSILKLVETKFNLPALTDRDANADDLLDCLDLHAAPAFAAPPALAKPRNSSITVPLCIAAGPIPTAV
ncbi:MAG: Phosphoesterase family protein [Acidimicrobiales bacterium]|nr:Phosphoesterase family protein [Acidimicrobiales bacterium]